MFLVDSEIIFEEMKFFYILMIVITCIHLRRNETFLYNIDYNNLYLFNQ
mgnify:CR=1 FL=1